jgi:two-component system response regulator NreC
MEQTPALPLSDRESQVLHLIAAGYMNKEIAARLGLGIKSVETYRQRLMAKLGLKTRAELTRYAMHAGGPSLPAGPSPKKAG